MSQRFIPAVYYRGGSSKGVMFHRHDLPANRAEIDPILLTVLGSPDPNGRQLNGMGGGISSLSKAIIIGKSEHPEADVDYLFAQVAVDKALVDTNPSCGNMLAGVGPFAIEQGLVHPHVGETTVRIFNVNTGSLIEAVVQTPGGTVTYEGDTAIDGVPGTAAPIALRFRNIAGGKTGRLLPTSLPKDIIDGIEVYASLREHHRQVPTIIITGFADEHQDTLAAMQDVTVTGVLNKPFDPELLLQRLEKLAA